MLPEKAQQQNFLKKFIFLSNSSFIFLFLCSFLSLSFFAMFYKSLACKVLLPFALALFFPSINISSTFFSRAVSTSSDTLETEFSLSSSFTTLLILILLLKHLL
jgi:hypothetical protein